MINKSKDLSVFVSLWLRTYLPLENEGTSFPSYTRMRLAPLPRPYSQGRNHKQNWRANSSFLTGQHTAFLRCLRRRWLQILIVSDVLPCSVANCKQANILSFSGLVPLYFYLWRRPSSCLMLDCSTQRDRDSRCFVRCLCSEQWMYHFASLDSLLMFVVWKSMKQRVWWSNKHDETLLKSAALTISGELC